ncbi:hypothetical protein [Carnobacterium pleistocenium]|uniref:hypothetical protein n=1 Tax=Carnobacterium pleistocenium TaxID=181073 RepID=UPI00068F8640|nr:hypothetical protein [Carnobacterium pleistocenium]
MPENSGWIALHRKLMNSDTFNRLTAIQRIIAIYLVLNANHKDNTWHDIYKDISVEIKRGQLVTSRAKIKEWFKKDNEVTERKIRTTLDKLEKYGFLTKQTTNNYTLITICHYNDYQDTKKVNDQVIDHQTSSDRPTSDQRVDHKQQSLNNDNNDKQVKENTSNQDLITHSFEEAWKLYPKKTAKKDAEAAFKKVIKNGTSIDDIKKGVERYVNHLEANKDWLKPMDGGRWFRKERWNDEYDKKTKTNRINQNENKYDDPFINERSASNELTRNDETNHGKNEDYLPF